jgi:hypothetical protein
MLEMSDLTLITFDDTVFCGTVPNFPYIVGKCRAVGDANLPDTSQ